MANEARIGCGLSIRKGNLNYNALPAAFTATVTTVGGPLPGMLTASIYGTVVDLAGLSNPSLCRIMNYDATNFITFGVYDGASFFPLGELLPGESYVLRLSRYLNREFDNTGTGTNADVNQLMVIADTAACKVLVEAFER